ncbi:MAG TPA: glycosyltransferase family 2 protein [Gemmatimonadaceae bacterium]|nr:glycosyltransferase family 2 protein [Gemmatimonadaceae bacterium]
MTRGALAVIPAYNEAQTIASVLRGLQAAAPDVARLVVTDGSRDGTAAVVTELGERHLELVCNVGYGRAVQAGLRYAMAHGYEVVVTLDGDGQHDPRDVPRVIEALATTGADVVIGSRYMGAHYRGPAERRAGQMAFSLLTRVLLGQRIYDTTSGLKAMRASACRAVLQGRFLDFHTEVLVRLRLLGFRIAEVPIDVQERTAGRSMYSFFRALVYPVKTGLLVITGILDALLRGRAK